MWKRIKSNTIAGVIFLLLFCRLFAARPVYRPVVTIIGNNYLKWNLKRNSAFSRKAAWKRIPIFHRKRRGSEYRFCAESGVEANSAFARKAAWKRIPLLPGKRRGSEFRFFAESGVESEFRFLPRIGVESEFRFLPRIGVESEFRFFVESGVEANSAFSWKAARKRIPVFPGKRRGSELKPTPVKILYYKMNNSISK